MAVNSPFPGWEILCLGDTELNVSPPGQSWASVEDGNSEGEEGGSLLERQANHPQSLLPPEALVHSMLDISKCTEGIINPPETL